MTPAQYRDAISRLGLSQLGAAAFLGVSPRTGQNYALKGPPEPVARFLRYLLAAKVTPEEVETLLHGSTVRTLVRSEEMDSLGSPFVESTDPADPPYKARGALLRGSRRS